MRIIKISIYTSTMRKDVIVQKIESKMLNPIELAIGMLEIEVLDPPTVGADDEYKEENERYKVIKLALEQERLFELTMLCNITPHNGLYSSDIIKTA